MQYEWIVLTKFLSESKSFVIHRWWEGNNKLQEILRYTQNSSNEYRPIRSLLKTSRLLQAARCGQDDNMDRFGYSCTNCEGVRPNCSRKTLLK